MITPVWISLGSNLGDRRAILDAAVVALNVTPGVVVTLVSSYRETVPVGGPPGQGPFLNAAARLETSLTPRELLAATQAIERDLGRVRSVRWGERTIDIDLLIYASKFLDEPDLKLPHPRLAVRRFVLEPLAEIAPDVVDTITRRTATDLLANLNRCPRIVMLDDSIRAKTPNLLEQLVDRLGAFPIRSDSVELESNWRRSARIEQKRRESLARVDAINTARANAVACSAKWLIADFWLDVADLKRYDPEYDPFPEFAARLGRTIATWQDGLKSNLDETPSPTLLVADPISRFSRRPYCCQTPVYWPEATEPDAVVDEFVAVCRGIAGE